MTDRRYGTFSITHALIEQQPEVVRAVMGEVIVVRAEMLYHLDAVRYTAISAHFAPVGMDQVTPVYRVIVRAPATASRRPVISFERELHPLEDS